MGAVEPRNQPPSPYRAVPLAGPTWKELDSVGHHYFGLSGNKLAGLIVRNWMRRRWPLELLPERATE